MTPPSLFKYLEFVLVDHFLRTFGLDDFADIKSAASFAKSHDFDTTAAKRYLDAMCFFGILNSNSGTNEYYINPTYSRPTENDQLFSEYRRFQFPLDSSSVKWPYEEDSDRVEKFDQFAARFSPEFYWSLKYHVLVINQFFQDQVIRAGLESGRSQTKLALGISHDQIFDNYRTNPKLLETYAEGFAHSTLQNNLEIAKHLNFISNVDYLDIGGGNGSQALAVKSVNPQIKSVSVLDLPESREPLAASRIRWADHFGNQAKWVFDNFFLDSFGSSTSLDQKFGCVTLSWILHDWNDEQCIDILKRAKSLLEPDGRLLVVEKIKTETNVANIQDFIMMIMADGCERTKSEYSAMFDACDLVIEKVVESERGRDLMILKRK